jgi:hypothetical protein
MTKVFLTVVFLNRIHGRARHADKSETTWASSSRQGCRSRVSPEVGASGRRHQCRSGTGLQQRNDSIRQAVSGSVSPPGAIDAWTRALGNTDVWRRWQDPGTLCRGIRQEISWQLEHMHPMSLVPRQKTEKVAANRRMLTVEISTNLKYYLNKGTVIEATAALETLLTNSDMDTNLPMSMVAPPYPAQYLRFGEAAMQNLRVPDSEAADSVFDGVFCFFTPDRARYAEGETVWTLELVFISKRQDRYNGHVALLGETNRGSTTVGEWLSNVLKSVAEQPVDEFHRAMHVAVSYVVRVFLYMALKQARVIEQPEYDEALRRAAGLGERKRAKLLQKSTSLYNSILVGPTFVPSATVAGGTGNGVAPHWRRGHFRMQPFGVGNLQRKLIFVAPVLIHADQLQGEVPAPKPYRAGAPAASEA